MPENIFDTADRFRAELLRRERQAATELVRAYGAVWRRIRQRLDDLGQQIALARQRGEDVSPAWLLQFERLQTLQRQVEAEIREFARYAEPVIVAGQAQAVQAAQEHAEQLVRAGLGEPPPGVTITFARLPADAVQDLVGFLQDGSPLRDLLDELGPEASRQVREALITGVATGQHPTVIARQVRQALGGNLVRALTIARTEVLRSYREASRRLYEANNDVVAGWYWHAALGPRTCLYCISKHGSFHSVDERLESHPRCRCAMVPATRTWSQLGFRGQVKQETRVEVEPGRDWFDRQPYDVKVAIMHPAAYEAYRTGWPLRELVAERRDPRWGTSGGPAPLRTALGTMAEHYRALAAETAHRRRTEPLWFAARDDADRIRAVLERMLDLHSRWSGTLELLRSSDYLWDYLWGVKYWTCKIGIEPTFIAPNQTRRFMVLVHELLHSLSVQSVQREANESAGRRGWEEGVVEAVTRLLYPKVARTLGIKLDDAVAQIMIRQNAYNGYIAELERLRGLLTQTEEQFYLGLLKQPVAERPGWLAQHAPRRRREREAFFNALAAADARLRKEP